MCTEGCYPVSYSSCKISARALVESYGESVDCLTVATVDKQFWDGKGLERARCSED